MERKILWKEKILKVMICMCAKIMFSFQLTLYGKSFFNNIKRDPKIN